MQETGGDDLFGDIFQDIKSDFENNDSKSAETHFNVGVAYREIGSTADAIVEFERALALGDPAMEFSINRHLGECYAEIEKYAEAAQYLQSALDAADDRMDVRDKLDLMVDLGTFLINQNMPKKALEILSEVDDQNANYRGCRTLIEKAKSMKDDDGTQGGGDGNIGYV
jgi:tetratricopeptide (TPR) repeat protein